MAKQWIIDISSIYEQDERLVKILFNNPHLEKKFLHKMVDSGKIEIVQFYDQKTGVTKWETTQTIYQISLLIL